MARKTIHFVHGLSRTPLLFIPRYYTNIFSKTSLQNKQISRIENLKIRNFKNPGSLTSAQPLAWDPAPLGYGLAPPPPSCCPHTCCHGMWHLGPTSPHPNVGLQPPSPHPTPPQMAFPFTWRSPLLICPWPGGGGARPWPNK